MAEERIIRARLRFETDPASAARANAATDQLKGRLKQLEDQAERTRKKMQALRQDAERLANVGRSLAFTGAAITGPLIAMAARYADVTGQTERVSRRWHAALRDIDTTQTRIGRVAATALLPTLERVASVAERAAALAEKHPDAVRNILGIGGGLVALGALTTVAANGIRLYADIKLLGASVLMDQAANKMLAAAAANAGVGGVGRAAVGGTLAGVAGVAGAAALGAGAGALIYDQGARATGGTTLGQILATTAAGYGRLFGGEELKREWFLAVSKLTGALDANTLAQLQAANNRLSQGGIVSGRTSAEWAAAVGGSGQMRERSAARYALQQAGLRSQARAAGGEAFTGYQDQLAALEADVASRRAAILEAFTARAESLESDYAENRARLIADFEQSEARRLSDFQDGQARTARAFALREERTEADYYANRLKRARDFGEDMARFEEDHQREVRYAAEDHGDRLRELAGGRDALGFVKEQRAYERERRRKEEEHQIEAARRNADFGQDLADAEAAFAEQRELRLADYELRLKDEQEAFDKETQQREQEQRERLQDLDAQYVKEKAKLDAAQREQERQLDAHNLREKNKLKAHLLAQYQQLATGLGDVYDLFGDFIQALSGTMTPGTEPWTPTPNPNGGDTPMATGGYATYGRYRMGERGREFVLNAMTTQGAERALGGMLSQERILSGLSGGGGGGSLSFSFAFNGALSEGDRHTLAGWVETKVVRVVTDAVRRARTGRH